MNNMFELTLCSIVVILLLVLLFTYKNKVKKLEKDAIDKFIRVKDINSEKQIIVLFLNYDDENFASVADLLNHNSCISIYIILNGPDWMVKMRKTTWNHHKVFSFVECSWIMPKPRTQITVYSKGKLVNVFEPYTFLKLNLQNS